MHFSHLPGPPKPACAPAACPWPPLATLLGYFLPWIEHPAAGLVVLGLDLAELVKFLYPVSAGRY